jgi:hypothetical protein
VVENGLSTVTPDDFTRITNGACVSWSSEGENSPALIAFVVDTSGSMVDQAPNNAVGDDRSKWEITSQTLQNAIEVLPNTTVVGMLPWPDMRTVPNHNDTTGGPVLPVDNCVDVSLMVPIAPLGPTGSTQRTSIGAALAGVSPAGGTPMADAYHYALDAVVNYSFLGPLNVVLITDGQPTIQLGCMGTGDEARPVDFQPVLDSVAGARSGPLGIKTFVIGSPGSEHTSSTGTDGRSNLSAAARAGGTGTTGCSDSGPKYCHFDMTRLANFATGFAAALQDIADQLLPCDFKITNIPQGQVVDQSALNIIYRIDGSRDLGLMRLVVPSADASCPQGNGWYLDPNDSTRVMLCANTCRQIHKDAGAVLEFRAGCRAIAATN